jgi:hypothetical protein
VRTKALLFAIGVVSTCSGLCAAEEEPRKEDEFRPSVVLGAGWGRAIGGRSVSRDAADVSAEIVVTPRAAVGLSSAIYAPFASDVQRDFPMSERLLSAIGFARVTVLGTPVGGHSLYVLGGVGAIWTRPLSLVDPANRRFDYAARIAFAGGVGARLFVVQHVAVGIELRDTTYIEQNENDAVADASHVADTDTWYGDKPVTNLVELRIGLSFEVPRQ